MNGSFRTDQDIAYFGNKDFRLTEIIMAIDIG